MKYLAQTDPFQLTQASPVVLILGIIFLLLVICILLLGLFREPIKAYASTIGKPSKLTSDPLMIDNVFLFAPDQEIKQGTSVNHAKYVYEWLLFKRKEALARQASTMELRLDIADYCSSSFFGGLARFVKFAREENCIKFRMCYDGTGSLGLTIEALETLNTLCGAHVVFVDVSRADKLAKKHAKKN